MAPPQKKEKFSMSITASQVKEIRTEFARLKPVKVTLDGNRSLTVKEAVFALAPTIERMKKRGFDAQEIAEKLHDKGIEVKPPTLVKYLNEFRRGKRKKTDIPPPPVKANMASQMAKPCVSGKYGGFPITPDTPLEDL
jgi:hypothetical protein